MIEGGPADRYHESQQLLVPVLVPGRSPAEGPIDLVNESAEATEFSVQASQQVLGDRTIWVSIVGERQYIDVTLESAVRLHAALGELVDKLWRG